MSTNFTNLNQIIKTLLTCSIAFISLDVVAQDTIRMHSGEILVAKVIANKPYSIEYTYPGETSYTAAPKSLVSNIIYSSGRKEAVSELINVNGEDGWKNVLITVNPEEVIGLTRVGEIRAKVDNLIGLNSASVVDVKANEKIQREAAMSGAHIVLFLQNDTKKSGYKVTAQSFKSGIAYRYPFKNLDSQLPYSGNLARRYYGADKAVEEDKGAVGQKVLFEHEDEVYEGQIIKEYGKFYKIKFTNKKGKEQTIEKHFSKVEFGTR